MNPGGNPQQSAGEGEQDAGNELQHSEGFCKPDVLCKALDRQPTAADVYCHLIGVCRASAPLCEGHQATARSDACGQAAA